MRFPIHVSVSALNESSPSQVPHFIEIIEKEGERMSRLISDMLSLASADNHSWVLSRTLCEPDTLILKIFEKYEPVFQSRHLHLSVQFPDTVLAPCSLDADAVSQTLGILLDNALSYVPKQGHVQITLSQDTANLLITVSDDGPGIPEEDRESVFLRFYRADTSRKDKQHFGLGLCIAKEIISLHGGTILAGASPQGGASFHISIPKKAV